MRTARFIKRKLRSLIHGNRAQGLILLYHRVAEPGIDPWQLCVSPKNFAEHLAVLKKFRPARLMELPESRNPKSVVVTFDDGYADNLHCAAPLLEMHDIPATFFLTSGYLGGTREFWWDELETRLASAAQAGCSLELTIRDRSLRWELNPVQRGPQAWLPIYFELYDLLQPLPHHERSGILERIGSCGRSDPAKISHRVMAIDEVRQLASMKLMEVGAHTITHPRLAAHSVNDQLAEMLGSKEFLETAIGGPVSSFSYPFGGTSHYSPESVRIARIAGFSAACTTTPAVVNASCNRFELPRVVIENIDGDRFEELLNCYLCNKN